MFSSPNIFKTSPVMTKLQLQLKKFFTATRGKRITTPTSDI